MPGLYSHTTRANGTTLTAAIYNGDHQNHIDNQTPQMTDDYSTNAAEMQSTANPGGVGTESLATSLAGEIERLRYVIKTMHGGVQWYPGSVLAVAANVIAKAALDAQGDVLIAESSSNPVSLPWPTNGAYVINGKVALSVAGGALTIALKGLDGNDPSASNPVLVRVPQGNPPDGTYAIRKVSAALSLTISAGSTLGHANNVASAVYFYLIDNAGTLELAAGSKFVSHSVISTTAEGGAGAADSATVIYSTTARTNVPAVVLSRWKSTQTTAGTWAATTGEQQQWPFPYKAATIQVFTSTGANTYTKPWDVLRVKVRVQGAGGGGGNATASDPGSASGGGGGGGGFSEKIIVADVVGPTETMTVGAGGGVASTGGTTSFGSHCSATGGGGGTSTNETQGSGGAGGAGSGGDINFEGGDGDNGMGGSGSNYPAAGGYGGNSHLGGGGKAGKIPSTSLASSAGSAGNIYGGGGGGGAANDGTGNGAAGANGIGIVEEFYF